MCYPLCIGALTVLLGWFVARPVLKTLELSPSTGSTSSQAEIQDSKASKGAASQFTGPDKHICRPWQEQLVGLRILATQRATGAPVGGQVRTWDSKRQLFVVRFDNGYDQIASEAQVRRQATVVDDDGKPVEWSTFLQDCSLSNLSSHGSDSEVLAHVKQRLALHEKRKKERMSSLVKEVHQRFEEGERRRVAHESNKEINKQLAAKSVQESVRRAEEAIYEREQKGERSPQAKQELYAIAEEVRCEIEQRWHAWSVLRGAAI
jgi:hypothetical protein